MTYPEVHRVLDLGIGRGGSYILSDANGTIRLGCDRRKKRIHAAKERYPAIIPLQMEVPFGRYISLPFSLESFNSIDILFPHNDLLMALASRTYPLWPELSRVLKNDGSVTIVLDTPSVGIREVHVPHANKPYVLESPEHHILDTAQLHGFTPGVRTLEKYEVYALGSDFAKKTAHDMRMDPLHVTSIIRAWKR